MQMEDLPAEEKYAFSLLQKGNDTMTDEEKEKDEWRVGMMKILLLIKQTFCTAINSLLTYYKNGYSYEYVNSLPN